MVQLKWLSGFVSVAFNFGYLYNIGSTTAIANRQADITLIVELSTVENIAIRSNGHILATNMSSPSLYSVDPVAKTVTTAVVIPGVTGLCAIREVTPDVFALIGGKGIYKVDFTGYSVEVTLIKEITEASNLNGLTVLNHDTILVGDAGKGVVYRFSISTGHYSVALSDPTMTPLDGSKWGIDGVAYKDGVVWYSNVLKNSFHKVPVDRTGKATAAVTTFWTDLMSDDLCFGPNGKIYLATNLGGNSVVEIDPAIGKANKIATVSGSSSCAFGRTAEDGELLYVGAGQGIFQVVVGI